jgi:hypothetical protein
VAAPGHDTCHAFMDFSVYGLTNLEVTRVTTGLGDTWHSGKVTWRVFIG